MLPCGEVSRGPQKQVLSCLGGDGGGGGVTAICTCVPIVPIVPGVN